MSTFAHLSSIQGYQPSQDGPESAFLKDEVEDRKRAITIEKELARLHMYDYERNAQMPKCTLVLRYLVSCIE
jgi:hypothetical protein